MSKLAVSLLLLPCLAGCAVVDLAAHSVKQYEKSKQPAAETRSATAQTAAPAADAAQVAEPEPVSAAPEPTGTIRTQSLD